MPGRPRLTVNVLTWNSESRLERLLREVSGYADEVLVGVDASSTDRTRDLALGFADVVYQFEHANQLAAARMLPFRYATGDWILSLDDDESLEASFESILPGLLEEAHATHVWLPRKWIVSLDPCEYLYAPPWFPDWQLRLFRNNRALVWKPPFAHSGYRVQGQGLYESRASILHFEPLWCSAEDRRRKLDRYRETDRDGSAVRVENLFTTPGDVPRRTAILRPSSTVSLPRRRGSLDPTVHEARISQYPPFRAEFETISLAPSAPSGVEMIAEIVVRNTGEMAWTPFTGHWPTIQLGYHLLSATGDRLEENGGRTALPGVVAPGELARFICVLTTPTVPGEYLLEWDLVSEFECWFAWNGSPVRRTPLLVTAREGRP